MNPTQILVIAKGPSPGRSKTRLCPPCTIAEASAIAEAALADTLWTLAGSGRPVTLVLDGRPGRWLPRGMNVIPQRGRGLDERLAHAFDDAGGPAILIGMDTPQVTAEGLHRCVSALEEPGVDAILGAADDGGWWVIGLRFPRHEAFLGVPMSTPVTGAAQRARLHRLGMRVATVSSLRDVDRWPDALAVAAAAPGGRFANVVRVIEGRVATRETTAAWTKKEAAV